MKKRTRILLPLMILAALAGCGGKHEPVPVPSKTSAVTEESGTGNVPLAGTAARTENGAADKGSGTKSETAAVPEPERESNAAEGLAESPEPDAGDGLEIRFIDVGQADSALVLCDGRAMLIDGGNAEDSDLLYTVLKNLAIDRLDYVVCTHAHEDHVGGLSGALNYATADTALCPVTDHDSKVFRNFVSCLEKQGVAITVPTPGTEFSLGSATVQILGPIHPDAEEPNNTSIVMRIVYGDTSFLFTGDAEREEEQDILDAGYPLASTVLKVGHHGSANSTTYPFLREVMPEYAVISVGEGNSYGHPTEEALSRLRDAGTKVYRTDMQGDIICRSDGRNVTFTVGRNEDADTLGGIGPNSVRGNTERKDAETGAAEGNGNGAGSGTGTGSGITDNGADGASGSGAAAAVTEYVLNTNSRKFHYPSCSGAAQIGEGNKAYITASREEVIGMGYEPCGICKP